MIKRFVVFAARRAEVDAPALAEARRTCISESPNCVIDRPEVDRPKSIDR
jgi:hypothetical protein